MVLRNDATVTDEAAFLVNERDVIVSASDMGLAGKYFIPRSDLEQRIGKEKTFSLVSYLDGSAYVAYFPIADTDWYMMSIIPALHIADAGRALMMHFALIYLLFTALALYTAFRLSGSIADRIISVALQMETVRTGPPQPMDVADTGCDEIGVLSDTYNYMTEEIITLMDSQKKASDELRMAEFRALQAQINPHFLYNTLDSIKWNARINQVPEIAVLAENLAVILRKSISSRPFITLREELETIESYVEIQKIRFTGRFLYETEIPDQLEDCMVPKMILQPLVENAIIHGLDGCGHGYICIYAFQKEGILNISVTDNGCGMSREMEDWINSDAPAKRDGHLGLYNVINILKIYYGQEYGVKAAVTEDGTTITLRLPVQKEVPDV